MSNTAQSLASTRIASLLDENSFVEIGGQVTARSTDFNMAGMETPSDGVITGYGVINGSLVYVYSQDASVMGGTIGEMHAKKIARLYEFAQKTGAPVIALVDCAGKNVPEALGDYFAGPNHTLPTSGTARFSSPLGVDDFVKKSSFIYYTREALGEVQGRIANFAEHEGLHAHARSVTIRFEE